MDCDPSERARNRGDARIAAQSQLQLQLDTCGAFQLERLSRMNVKQCYYCPRSDDRIG